MTMSRVLARSLCLFVLFTLFCFNMTAAASKPYGTDLNETTFSQKFLSGHSLDAIEGIWNIKGGNFNLQLAVCRNATGSYADYDYLGIFLQPLGGPLPLWSNGDFCLGLKKSADPSFFNGFWLVPNILWTDKWPTPLTYIAANDSLQLQYPGGFGQVISLTGTRSSASGSAIGGVRTGSGFFITPTLLVTCAHLVEGATQISVEFRSDGKLPAARIAVDRVNDLALLRVVGWELFATPLVLAPPRGDSIGERIYGAGFPTPGVLGRSLKFSDGIINSLTGLADDPRAFQINLAVLPGLSGGPLLNTHGQVCGILIPNQALGYFFYKGQSVPASANFAIKASALSALLNSLGDGERYAIGDNSAASLDLPQIAEIAKNATVLIEVK